jgi:acyl carrier protein
MSTEEPTIIGSRKPTLPKMTVAERVDDLILRELGVEEDELKDGRARLIEDLGADSIDAVELAIAIEEEFELADVPDETVEKWKTVKQVRDYVGRAVQKRGKP